MRHPIDRNQSPIWRMTEIRDCDAILHRGDAQIVVDKTVFTSHSSI